MRPLDPTEWLAAKRLEALAAGDHAGFDHATALLDTLDECQPYLEDERTAIDVLRDLETDMSEYPGRDLSAQLDWLYRLVDKLQTHWAVDTLDQLPDRIDDEVERMTELADTVSGMLFRAGVIGNRNLPDNETIGTLLRMFLPEASDR